MDENLASAAPPPSGSLTQVEIESLDPRAALLGMGRPVQPAVNKGGRPRVLTAEVAERLCHLITIGCSRRQAAAYLGISPSTITNAIDHDPALGEELARAELLSEMQPELTVMAEARRNWKAASWYLEFKRRNPRPLSAEEKEARHREAMEENRRSAAEQRVFLQGLSRDPVPGVEFQDSPRVVVRTRKKKRKG